jgi:hypothetical protein
VSDVQESIFMVVYKFQENRLIPFVDDTIARWTSCTTMVDYETVAGATSLATYGLFAVRPRRVRRQMKKDQELIFFMNDSTFKVPLIVLP